MLYMNILIYEEILNNRLNLIAHIGVVSIIDSWYYLVL